MPVRQRIALFLLGSAITTRLRRPVDIARPAMPTRPPHPHPTFVTVAKRPSCGQERGEVVKVFCPTAQVRKFIAKGLDNPNRLERVQESAVCAQTEIIPLAVGAA